MEMMWDWPALSRMGVTASGQFILARSYARFFTLLARLLCVGIAQELRFTASQLLQPDGSDWELPEVPSGNQLADHQKVTRSLQSIPDFSQPISHQEFPMQSRMAKAINFIGAVAR